jgi:nitronate monooxygenase
MVLGYPIDGDACAPVGSFGAMLRTPVTELLEIEHPILQAPMASAATPALAAAVSEAGGLGALGSSLLPVDELRRQTGELRERTGRPFQLNFFCHEPPEVSDDIAERAREYFAPLYDELGLGDPPQPTTPAVDFDDARLEALLELRPPVVSFHFGLPPRETVDTIHEAGMLVLASATTVAEARHLEEHGADAVVAQGAEAGGHRGSFLVEGDDGPVGTLALVPQVVDAVGVPVIAAGGIADGRGLAAVLALGAGAAQIGTAFLPCPESGISDAYREALRDARADGTVVTRGVSGRPARALRNRIAQELSGVLPYPAQLSLTGPLFASKGAAADFQPMWSGQGVALATEAPAAQVVAAIVAGAEAIAGR